MLRSFIEQPLAVKEDIDKRLDAVDVLRNADMTVDLLREELTQVYDIERLLSRISYRTINAKDCLALKESLSHVPAIFHALKALAPQGILEELVEHLTPLDDIVELLGAGEVAPNAFVSLFTCKNIKVRLLMLYCPVFSEEKVKKQRRTANKMFQGGNDHMHLGMIIRQ